MTVQQVASAYQRMQAALAGRTAVQILEMWRNIPMSRLSHDWSIVAPVAAMLLLRSQYVSAANAEPYLEDVALAFGAVSLTSAPVRPDAFAGVAADGRTLEGLLLTGPVTAKRVIAAGGTLAEARQAGSAALRAAVETQVVEAASSAMHVSMFVRDAPPPPTAEVVKGPGGRTFIRDSQGGTKPYFRPKHYVRMVQPGACARCIVLAGKRYGRRVAFLRHPLCHCTHIPVDENIDDYPATDPKAYFDSLTPEERKKTFGKAGAESIELGADMSQIVNARRGMYVTKGGLQATRIGTTKRGAFGQASPRTARLMPEEIFRLSNGNREEALRLLRQYRYIL
jgi:hypothetical protein